MNSLVRNVIMLIKAEIAIIARPFGRDLRACFHGNNLIIFRKGPKVINAAKRTQAALLAM